MEITQLEQQKEKKYVIKNEDYLQDLQNNTKLTNNHIIVLQQAGS